MKYCIDGSCRRLCSANINSRGSAARSLKSTTVKLSDNKMFHALGWHLLSSTNRPYNGASRCCSGQVSTSVNSCSIGNASGEIAGNVLPSLTCTFTHHLCGKQSHALGEPTSGQRIKSIAGTHALTAGSVFAGRCQLTHYVGHHHQQSQLLEQYLCLCSQRCRHCLEANLHIQRLKPTVGSAWHAAASKSRAWCPRCRCCLTSTCQL